MSTYEIPGFDPTSKTENPELPFAVWHNKVNGINFHLVHFQELERQIRAGKKITLINEEGGKSKNIKSIESTVRGGKNYDNKDATLYSTVIDLRKEREWRDSFTHHLHHTSYENIAPEQFQWSNIRLLRRPGTLLVAQAAIYSNYIQLLNQMTSTATTDPLKSVRLIAPAQSSIKSGEQISHTFDAISAVLCVANSLGKDSVTSPGGSYIITPNGPLYRNPDTGDYVHRLGRESITLSSAKKAEATHPGLDQLFGIEDIQEELQQTILFYKNPELAAKWHVNRPGNILFLGPPGTGKTTLAHALATEIDADTYEINSAEIYGKWLGDAEKAMQALFDKARAATKPTVLLFDEIEGIINIVDNDSSGARATNAVAGIFKTQSTKVTTENPNVILVATTNDANRIDAALIRAGRFDQRITVGLPNEEARRQMFGNLIANHQSMDLDTLLLTEATPASKTFNPYNSSLMDPEALTRLAHLTDHEFSAADIVEVLRKANLAKAREEQRTGKEPAPIDLEFLAKIIVEMRQNR